MTPTKQQQASKNLYALRQFLSFRQAETIREALRGEERNHFANVLAHWAHVVKTMPATYETNDLGDRATVHLHYFMGNADWYIVEKDAGAADDVTEGQQAQAFGFACLFGDEGEMGYISIEELRRLGAELDLYWQPKTLAEVKEKRA